MSTDTKALDQYHSIRPEQMAAAEIKAVIPNITYKEIAVKLGYSPDTVRSWFKNPSITEAAYEKFMEIAGVRLITVLDAMLREAEEGNVNAAQLVLKHWGKLEDKTIIQITDSPFEKFIKLKSIPAEVIEDTGMDPQDNDGPMDYILETLSDIPITEDLPVRNEKNDKPRARTYRQTKRLKKQLSNARRKDNKRKAYANRQRAEKVGLKQLPPGRPANHIKKAWLKKLERLEKEQSLQS